MSPASADAVVRLASGIYAKLLRLLPSEERQRDGGQMLELFGRLAGEARWRGRLVVLAVTVRASVDLVGHAIRVRVMRFGGSHIHPDDSPRSRSGQMLDTLHQDLRAAVRALVRRPGFSFLACATFALGIGATAAMFSVVDAMLLRRLPYEDPDRIVRLMGTRRDVVNLQGTLSYLNVRDVLERSTSFASGAAYDEWQPNLTGGGEPERLEGAQVNTDFFTVFGIEPAVGRFFEPEEDVDGRDRVVVLSWGLWQRRFGGDRGIVGQSIDLNGNPHVVIGVAPQDFEDPKLSGPGWRDPVLWRPLGYVGVSEDQQPSRGSSSYVAVARLAPGVTLTRARSELSSLSQALEEQYPENEGDGMTAVPLRESIIGETRSSLLLLFGAVAFVLAIAAANVGNLLLGHATERQHEMALRTAIGASRRRVIALALTETMLLAFIGAAAGIGVAALAIRGISGVAAGFVPRSAPVEINLPVLAFAIGVTLLAGLICATAPALIAVHTDPRNSLGESGRTSTSSRRSGRLRRSLVAVECALALILLIGAGLVGRSLYELMSVDVGIDTSNLLTFNLALSSASYPSADAAVIFYQELDRRIESLPGVQAAGAVNIVPLSGNFDCSTVSTPQNPEPGPDERVCPQTRTVTPSYFETAGVTLRTGRLLDDRDRAGSQRVVVITESLARALWNGEDAVGRQLIAQGEPAEVVGVVSNVKHLSLEEDAPPLLYVAHAQQIYGWHTRRLAVLVRTSTDPLALLPAVRSEVAALDPLLPVADPRSMEQIVSRSASGPRFRTVLLTTFATLALVLAAIGIYGVVSCSVAQRSRELAIRAALGARTDALLRMVLRDGLAPVAIGLAIGLLAAFGLSRVLAAVLFGVTATDTAVFLTVPALLLLVAAAASLLPAWHAARADPMGILRDG